MSTKNTDEKWVFDSPEETRSFGRALGESLVGGSAIGLIGPLGAGKTVLVKGIAAGNATASDAVVTSPTFTLVHEHPGRLKLYHIDAYRLKSPDELRALGFDEMLRPDAVVVVEWAGRVERVMPDDVLWLTLEPLGTTRRAVRARADGALAEECLRGLQSHTTPDRGECS